MRRLFLPLVAIALGLLLGGAIAGWPARVKSDVVIESVPTTTVAAGPPEATPPPLDTTVDDGPPEATTLPNP